MKALTVTGITLVWAAAAWAAEIQPLDVKVGLWETTAKTEMPGMPKMQAAPQIPQEALAKMTPEQRANIEAMLKSRASGGPMVTTTKVCMTRESMSNALAFSRADKSCTPKVVSSSSSRQQIHVDCNRDGHQMSGDLTVDRVDAEHIKGNMVMKGGQGGPPVNMRMSFETRWVSADCGSVKPPMAK